MREVLNTHFYTLGTEINKKEKNEQIVYVTQLFFRTSEYF